MPPCTCLNFLLYLILIQKKVILVMFQDPVQRSHDSEASTPFSQRLHLSWHLYQFVVCLTSFSLSCKHLGGGTYSSLSPQQLSAWFIVVLNKKWIGLNWKYCLSDKVIVYHKGIFKMWPFFLYKAIKGRCSVLLLLLIYKASWWFSSISIKVRAVQKWCGKYWEGLTETSNT